MKAFANLTREISAANAAAESVHKAIDDAWTAVGL